MLLSGTLLLKHLGLDTHARAISEAVFKTLRESKVKTADLGGKSSTTDFTLAVISNL
jgi:isocitrate dehydrogenase (NAD+)